MYANSVHFVFLCVYMYNGKSVSDTYGSYIIAYQNHILYERINVYATFV